MGRIFCDGDQKHRELTVVVGAVEDLFRHVACDFARDGIDDCVRDHDPLLRCAYFNVSIHVLDSMHDTIVRLTQDAR